MSEDLVGKVLGKYELHQRIGRGGMAEVYKALHVKLQRYVALKILHPFLSEDPEFKERFEREARNVAQLRHPSIVQVYDFDYDPDHGRYYMIMEYIDGPTLRTYLMQRSFQGGQIPIDQAVHITRELANALAYAHSQEMIHRDIKPSNIMLDSDDRVVLTDFGIARIITGPQMTISGSMVGTPTYMSPEQGLGQPGDHRSDVYSLGVVLYQLVTGTLPYDADTPIAVILKHVNDPLPQPSNINPDIPSGLEMIIYKALAKAPGERYQDIAEMAYHLDHLQEAAASLSRPTSRAFGVDSAGGASVLAPPGVGLADGGAKRKRRGGCLSWLALTFISLLAMAAGIYLAFTGLLSSHVPFLPSAEIVLTNTPIPTSTQEPTPAAEQVLTLTPDLQGTQISLTVDALASLVATPQGVNPTPDMTATTQACDYDYEIISQTPPNGSGYPELTTLTETITIINDSKCPLDDDTRLVFSDGLRMDGPGFIEFNRQLQPGDEHTIVLSLLTPPINPADPIIRSTWVILLPDGTQVGPPLTIELVLLPGESTPDETGGG